MTADLSRRGLFRAFRSIEEHPTATGVPEALVARIGEGCVEPRGVTCRRCGEECDAGAISFRLIGQGKAHVFLNAETCTGCAACAPVCPVHAISMVPAERNALIAGLVELGRAS